MRNEINIYRLINVFNKMSKRGVLLTGNGITQNDLLTQIIGTIVNISLEQYTWKDIVKINGNVYAEEFPISGKMDCQSIYQIDDFLYSVARKHGVSVEDIETYMIDNIDFDSSDLSFGIEDCGCYINGIAEWLEE